MGKISGLQTEDLGFYVERLPKPDTLLVFIFNEGFQPKAISFKPLYFGAESPSSSGDSALWQPLELKHDQTVFTFYGKRLTGSFSGTVKTGDGKTGKWELRPVTEAEVSEGLVELAQSSLDLQQWLLYKSQLLELKRKIKSVVRLREQKQEYYAKLDKFVADEQLLKERATTRREELKHELERAIQNQKELSSTVSNFESELDLLNRITKKGKAISLARRVINRETKWYLANWRAEEDSASLDEFFSEHPQVDLSQLEADVKKSNEIRLLLHQISTEKQKIAELEGRQMEGQEPLSPPLQAVPTVPEKKGTKDRSFWGDLF